MPKLIDFHVHPNTQEFWTSGGEFLKSAEGYFGRTIPIETLAEMAAEYRSMDMMGVLLAWDTETQTGLPAVNNDFVAAAVRTYPDVFMGFACADPWKGKAAINELDRAIHELGLIGVKFQQIAQAFCPNDPRFYPIYEKCCQWKVPVMFHCGTTGYGGGSRGGNGIKLKYGDPMFVDDVAADFPDLNIICAHPAFPWQDEMIAIALHKTNVYMDLSGWAPKHFPENLVKHIGRLQDRILFGTDYPVIKPQRWLAEFAALPVPDAARPKVLYQNAAKLLGLSTD